MKDGSIEKFEQPVQTTSRAEVGESLVCHKQKNIPTHYDEFTQDVLTTINTA
jgi:hypothetical protein